METKRTLKRNNNEKKTTPAGKVMSIITTVLVIISVLVAVVLMGLRIAGFHTYTVLSGSMEPKFSVGDLIYVKEVDPSEIKVGDSITFVLNENLVVATHQVIRIDAENEHFYTKGLANDTPDAAPVHYNNVIGRAEFSIPYVGYVSDWIQHPPGLYITLLAVALLIVIIFLPDIFGGAAKKAAAEASVETEEEKKNREELERMRAELADVKAKLAQQKEQSSSEENREEK